MERDGDDIIVSKQKQIRVFVNVNDTITIEEGGVRGERVCIKPEHCEAVAQALLDIAKRMKSAK